MKLLFAIKSMNHYTGGAERVLADVTAGLAERGHDISLITFDKPGGSPVYPLHHAIHRIDMGIGDTTHPATVGETIKRMIALRRATASIKPDIVIPFMHSLFVPMSIALIGSGMPVIASEHIVPAHYKERPLEFFLLKTSRFFITRFTVLSETVRSLYPAPLRKKMVIMPNPVLTPQAFANAGDDMANPKIILSIGRLDTQKNQHVLIKAFAELADEFSDWQLRIIGEGPLRGDLEKLVASLHLEHRIFLPGTTRDIGPEYARAHIFALPSSYESFGLATAEALLHGLPAIGFRNCAGTNELIHHARNGYLVDDDKPVTYFAAALKTLMADPTLRAKIGEIARRSLPQYGREAVIDQWVNLLNSIIRK